MGSAERLVLKSESLEKLGINIEDYYLIGKRTTEYCFSFFKFAARKALRREILEQAIDEGANLAVITSKTDIRRKFKYRMSYHFSLYMHR